MNMQKKVIRINGTDVEPGQRLTIDIPVARLHTHTPVNMPVHIIRSKRPGPCLFVCAAVHGDEINGVEIIRRLLRQPGLKRLHGTLLAVPIVNVFGFLNHTRYLPDRRDLNRSFPGSEKGSLTARLADLFVREIVEHATHGIDLHTGAVHRTNLPQIRANLEDAETERLARAFSAPVLLNTDTRDGSLRQVATDMGVTMLLYEAGEALRFDEITIRAGVHGIIEVMRALDMLPASRRKRQSSEPVIALSSSWIRAPASGILRTVAPLGAHIRRGTLLGMISDPFGEQEIEVRTNFSGVIIGRNNLPLVNEGDALFNIGRFEKPKDVAAQVEAFHSTAHDLLDETEEFEPPIV